MGAVLRCLYFETRRTPQKIKEEVMEEQHVDRPELGEWWYQCRDCHNYQINARCGVCDECRSENVWPVSKSTKKTLTLGRTVIFLGVGRIPKIYHKDNG
jgi:recombinational DNA repair protein RecR